MRHELSPGLERTLERAAAWAGAAPLETAHLWRALVEDEDHQAWQLLERAGLPRSKVALAWLQNPPGETGSHSHKFATVFRDLLLSAAELEGDSTLTTTSVLVALLEMNEPLRQQLEASGLDFARFRETALPPRRTIDIDMSLFDDPAPPPTDVARIVDAAGNRAREALRVLEDYCRFVLNDAGFHRELKETRHALTEALAAIPTHWLLQSRDTPGDVGAAISTPREMSRESTSDVLQANSKRLQEALRSLEEFGKQISPELAAALERIRYRSYTLEKNLLLGLRSRQRFDGVQLYVLVTESLCRASLVGTVAEALAGGAQVIQLREKQDSDRRILEKARPIRELTRKAGAIFIVNDRPDLARLAEADGVHLGQDDLDVRDARRILGSDALIGVSTHDVDQVRQAIQDGADYLGIGPTFPSRTKEFSQFAGLEFIRQASAQTTLPAFALGGITAENMAEVWKAGATRIAVSHAICGAEDPRAAARALREALAV